jgi:CRP/FNR family cyclic AMP-dependent transcriptional regulator
MRFSGKRPFFDPRMYLSKIRSGTTRAKFRRQQIVYSQGNTADSVFYILEGTVELRLFSEQDREMIITVLDIGDFFGEGCLAGEPRRMANAVAVSECSVVRIEKSAMITMLREEPAFSARFISFLLNRDIRTGEALVDTLFSPSEKRLARLLLLLANFGKEGRSELVIANISQEGLAEILRTTRSKIRFTMNKFRKCGLIEYNNGLRVHSSLLNVILYD